MASFEDTAEYIRNKFWDFLETYQDIVGDEESTLFYIKQLESMREEDKTTMYVDMDHLNNFDPDLADLVQVTSSKKGGEGLEHSYRLDPVLKKALQNFVRVHMAEHVQDEENNDREFWVSFYNMPLIERMRDLKAGKLGRLVSFAGTVTRTSEVRPELYLATFKCNECGERVRNVEQQFKYTQPLICSNSTCGNRKSWELIREESAFVDWQRVKVQECSDEVPAGSLPRTSDVILRHDIVESARAGDKVVFTGNVIVVPDVGAISTPGERVEASLSKGGQGGSTEGVGGLKYLGARELTYKLAFLASSTQASDAKLGMVNIRADDTATPEELLGAMTEAERNEIVSIKRNPRLYDDLAKSLAPGVYGHEDVKRAVLLMLLGGVHKETSEGINLRGDINVAIIGDPSCAKSQILKYVANFLPRAVYTSGKSSSAAGLTASVVKEQDSNEFCIEAGALMLADNGICCIDEFDKMDVKDQVAIHEAMEQQTISIAKAGIQATLNARTSILAAANPVGGRYDRSKPLRYNVALPPAILSRFDLLHIMIDEPDDVLDYQVARHIVAVHQKKDLAFDAPYSMTQIQRYIKFARSLKPRITPEAKAMLVDGYKRLRTEDAVPGSSTSYRITVRQLEALVRLSEALARLRCTDVIQPQYVREAVRLVKNSIIAIESPEAEVDDVDFVDDLDEIHDVVERFRRSEQIAAHRPPDQQPSQGVRNEGTGEGPGSRQGGDDQATPPVSGARGEAQALEAQRQEAEAGIAALQRQRQPTKVSQKKVDQVKNLLVMKLREVEENGGGASAAIGSIEVAAMTQHDLITWYFDYQTAREALGSNEEVQAEVVLVTKIVQHLIRKEAILVVVETPARNPGEDDLNYARRQQRERVLALNPNYSNE